MLQSSSKISSSSPRASSQSPSTALEAKGPLSTSERMRMQGKAPRKHVPDGVSLMLHLGNTGDKEAIHESGLVPGAGKGIGLPNEDGVGRGDGDKEHIYALDGEDRSTTSLVSGEAGGQPVVIVSRNQGTRDVNYKKGARKFLGKVPPVRNFQEGAMPADDEAPNTYSMTLPMTPRTAAGVSRFMKAKEGSEHELDDEIRHRMYEQFDIAAAEGMEARRPAVQEEVDDDDDSNQGGGDDDSDDLMFKMD